MTARSGSSNGLTSAAEKIEESPRENANIEMTDAGNSEAVHDDIVDVVESQTNQEANPLENTSVEVEEDQVLTNLV